MHELKFSSMSDHRSDYGIDVILGRVDVSIISELRKSCACTAIDNHIYYNKKSSECEFVFSNFW